MLGYFFQVFFFVCVKKKPNHVHRTFLEYFFQKKKKKLKKYSTHVRWTYMVFFFQVFIFFSSKKKTTHVLRHAWFFSNFFSSFDIFQACSSDVHVFQACSSDYQLINALSRKKVVWSSWLFLCTTHCFLEIRTCFDVSYFNSELRKNAEKLDCSWPYEQLFAKYSP